MTRCSLARQWPPLASGLRTSLGKACPARDHDSAPYCAVCWVSEISSLPLAPERRGHPTSPQKPVTQHSIRATAPPRPHAPDTERPVSPVCIQNTHLKASVPCPCPTLRLPSFTHSGGPFARLDAEALHGPAAESLSGNAPASSCVSPSCSSPSRAPCRAVSMGRGCSPGHAGGWGARGRLRGILALCSPEGPRHRTRGSFDHTW